MKKEDLIDALSLIDEDMIEKTDRLRKERQSRKRKYRSIAAAAACFLIAVYSGIRFFPWEGNETLPVSSDSSLFSSSDPVSSSSDVSASSEPSLQILNLGDADFGMGFEGYEVYQFSDLISQNPWNENVSLTTLPVYENPLSYNEAHLLTGGDFEAMEEMLLWIADALSIDQSELTITDNAPTEEEIEKFAYKNWHDLIRRVLHE